MARRTRIDLRGASFHVLNRGIEKRLIFRPRLSVMYRRDPIAPNGFLGTLPFLYLSSHPLNLPLLAGALFIRGVGMSAVGVPSISAAYASVRRQELTMATTSLNIVRRLAGPTLTTLCATFLGWRLAAVHAPADLAGAFTVSFALLCTLQALLILAAIRLPVSLQAAQRSIPTDPVVAANLDSVAE